MWLLYTDLKNSPDAVREFHHLHPSAPHSASPLQPCPSTSTLRQSGMKGGGGDLKTCHFCIHCITPPQPLPFPLVLFPCFFPHYPIFSFPTPLLLIILLYPL